MKTAEYETENSFSVCPILEDVDLDAMTDEALREERSRWCMPYANDEDPMAWDVDRNYRLVERHLELRAMTDEEVAKELEQAKWAIDHWGMKDGDPVAARMIRDWTADADNYAREMRRRGIGEASILPSTDLRSRDVKRDPRPQGSCMIRLPKYGRNVRRYADAAFDAAWREVVGIGIPGVREYLSASNPECAVPFNVNLKFGSSGLIGATVARVPPKGEFEFVADHICPLWDIEFQRREWHSQIYRTVVHRYAIERYGPASGKRPLYQMPDDEVTAMAVSSTDVGDDFVQRVVAQCRSMAARWELEHRARESNHARIERLGAQKESV